MPPLSDQKNYQDAQWSPKPRKFCFGVTAAAWPVCLLWTAKTAAVAQQVTQKRQNGGRTIVAMVVQWFSVWLNGGTVVATVIAQWTPLVARRRHNGGTREAEASLKFIHNAYNSVHFLQGDQWPTPVHPFCYHSDACASFLAPLSDWPPRRDCFEHAQLISSESYCCTVYTVWR